MMLDKEKVFRGVGPVHGMREAPIQLFKTYRNCNKTKLIMFSATLDPCQMVRKNGNTLEGITVMQVEDTILGAIMELGRKEDKASQELPSESCIHIGEE